MTQRTKTRLDGNTLVLRIPMRFNAAAAASASSRRTGASLRRARSHSPTARWSRRSRGRGDGIYTSCADVCPMLTDKLARVQDELGSDFGSNVAFVSITADRSGTPPRC